MYLLLLSFAFVSSVNFQAITNLISCYFNLFISERKGEEMHDKGKLIAVIDAGTKRIRVVVCCLKFENRPISFFVYLNVICIFHAHLILNRYSNQSHNLKNCANMKLPFSKSIRMNDGWNKIQWKFWKWYANVSMKRL